jgi:LacI family transcriptional regulator
MGGAKSWLLVSFNDRQLTIANWQSARGNDWIDQMQHGAMLACEKAQYHFVMELIDSSSSDLERNVTSVISRLRPDGVLLTPPSSDNPVVLKTLRKLEVPFVRIGSARGKGPGHRVFMDERAATQEITHHLIGLGHHRIALITGSPEHSSSPRKVEAFEKAMRRAGIDDTDILVEPGDFTFESGLVAARNLLDRAVPPTAIIGSNDEMTLAALHIAQQRGIAVPDDLSLVSFDDGSGVRFSHPPITSVHQPVAAMAAKGVETLVAIAAANADMPETSDALLPYTLLIRESSAKPRQA